MASVTPCSLRAARGLKTSKGGICFDLTRFDARLTSILGWEKSQFPRSAGIDLSTGPGALSSYLNGEIFSKFDDGQKDVVREKVTWEKFHDAERLCFETNQRLAVSGLRGPHEQVLLLARDIAARILGRFDWNAAAKGFGWGPGATTRQPRRMSDAAYKYSGLPESTIGNAVLADACFKSIPPWKLALEKLPPGDVGHCKIVSGNRIVTVPKNYKTDRTIAIEPCMNMYVQKGIGALMRRRLRLAGCNLDDQTRNQRLARIGSISGLLSTVDLSMASDTISRVLVSLLIRPDWLSALEQCRSPFGVLPSGEKIFYQKFSSMGNGFTFELESLIFYSLALAWTHLSGEDTSRVSVYGDDIILPSACAGSFSDLLSFVGFKMNEKKSYWSGPFRESCGKHYYSGDDVTPFYVRRPVKKLTDLFLLHNNLFRWSRNVRRLLDYELFLEVESLRKWIRSFAPAKWRTPRLPDGYGDGAFIGESHELSLRCHPYGWECWTVVILTDTPKSVEFDGDGLLVKALETVTKEFQPDRRGILPVTVGRHREVKISIPRYALAN